MVQHPGGETGGKMRPLFVPNRRKRDGPAWLRFEHRQRLLLQHAGAAAILRQLGQIEAQAAEYAAELRTASAGGGEEPVGKSRGRVAQQRQIEKCCRRAIRLKSGQAARAALRRGDPPGGLRQRVQQRLARQSGCHLQFAESGESVLRQPRFVRQRQRQQPLQAVFAKPARPRDAHDPLTLAASEVAHQGRPAQFEVSAPRQHCMHARRRREQRQAMNRRTRQPVRRGVKRRDPGVRDPGEIIGRLHEQLQRLGRVHWAGGGQFLAAEAPAEEIGVAPPVVEAAARDQKEADR